MERCTDAHASENLGRGPRQCGPPEPSVPSGILKVSLKSGAVHHVVVQSDRLAGVSWGFSGGMRVLFGSALDEGVVICDTY